LTEPPKINQIAVLFCSCFKLNKAERFILVPLVLNKLNVMKFLLNGGAVFLMVSFLISSCKSKDKAADQSVKYDKVFFDYTITAEEGGPYATCMFQYKKDGLDGNAINIAPGKVELDGQALEGDSAGLSGYYYEIRKPLDSFAGKHTIVFTNPADDQYKEEFEFTPFTLAEELPAKTLRKPFVIHLKNFPKTKTPLRLLLLDTAFESRGFNDIVPVVNSEISITQSILSTLKKGPINLELYMEEERPLQQHGSAGGRLSITYGLKRAFELE